MPSLSHRAYFLLVGLFAAWVGGWGFLAPAEVGRALPWTVPPLHARFIASMYLAGFVAMAWCLFARQLAAMRIAIALAAVWTGALLLVSLLRLGDFDFAKLQVMFWMGAYAVYPLWGAWLYFAAGVSRTAEPRPRLDAGLAAVGIASLLLAAALLVAPETMVRAWPWKVSPLLANIYFGPFLAWGVAALMLAREARAGSRRIVLASMFVFVLLTLLASLMHLGLFHFDAPAAWGWFGGFAVVALVLVRSLLFGRPAL